MKNQPENPLIILTLGAACLLLGFYGSIQTANLVFPGLWNFQTYPLILSQFVITILLAAGIAAPNLLLSRRFGVNRNFRIAQILIFSIACGLIILIPPDLANHPLWRKAFDVDRALSWIVLLVLVGILGYKLDRRDPDHHPKWYPGFLSSALMAAFIYGSTQILWGEKTPFAGGYHWDAIVYAQAAKDISAAIFGHTLQAYWLQRMAPTVIVGSVLRLFNIPLEDQNIIFSFEIYSFFTWLLSIYIWRLISNELKLKKHSEWIGFILLFINQISIKFRFWLPTFSDNSAFLLGMLMVLFFIKRRQLGLLLVMIIGEFTWPSIFIFGAPLFLFPKKPLSETQAPKNGNLIAGAIASLIIISFYFFPFYPPGNFQGYERGYGFIGIISLLFAAIFLFYTVSKITNNKELFQFLWFSEKKFWLRLSILASTILIIRLIVKILENGVPFEGVHSLAQWMEVGIISPATNMPLEFMIMHGVIFGLVIIFIIIFFQSFVAEIHRLGIGAILFMCGCLLFFLDVQVRHNIHFLPFIVTIVAKNLDELDLKPFHTISIFIAAIFTSKVWMPYKIINPPDFVDCKLPQLYSLCLSTGFGRADYNYYQGLVLAITGIFLFIILKPLIIKRKGCEIY